MKIEIPIFSIHSTAAKLAPEIEKLLMNCGLAFCIRLDAPNQFQPGGKIIITRLKLRKATRQKLGVKNDDGRTRAYFIIKKLLKGYKGIRIKGPADRSVRVRCLRQLHDITYKKEKLLLEAHPKSTIECDRTLSILSQAEDFPRCLRIYDVWRSLNKYEANGRYLNLPPPLAPVFRYVLFKRQIRSNIFNDMSGYYSQHHTETPTELHHRRARVVIPIIERELQQRNYAHLFPSVREFGCQIQYSTFNYKSPMHFSNLSSLIYKPRCVLYVDNNSLNDWFTNVYKQGLASVDNCFVLTCLNTYSRTTRAVKLVRPKLKHRNNSNDYYALVEEKAVVEQSDDKSWHIKRTFGEE